MTSRHTLLIGMAIGLGIGAIGTGVVMTNFGPAEPAANEARGPGGPGARGGRGGAGGRRGYAPVVAMERARAAAVERTIEVIGEARALKSVAITAEVAGLVEEIAIAPGARVKEGDVLLRIVDDEQEVALNRARADYPIAKQNADRYRLLESDAAASELESEQAQNAYIAAQAALGAAEVAVAQRRITAPFDGIVGLTNIEAGDYLRVGDAVTTLDDTSSVLVEFSVPQESAAFMNLGQPIEAALTSGARQKHAGVITAIDSRVDPESRSLRAEATIANDGGRLIPGAVFSVKTTAPGEPAVAVSGLAIQWDRLGAFVWRRGEDGAAERASVVILQRSDEIVLVEGDIQPGDAIVSEGANRVRRGIALPPISAPSGGRDAGVAAGAE